MSDLSNPYNSPQSPIVPEKIQNGAMTDTMLRYLKETAPWLKFIGIIGFIGFGFTCLSGVIFFITSLVSFSITNLAASIAYILLALVVFFPARFTYLFGSKISNYMLSNSDEDLETAFKNNKSFWKFYGILLIIYLALIPVTIILIIAGALASFTGIF